MLTDISKWVDAILAEIVKSNLLDTESRFYEVSKERLLRTFTHIYPLTEFIDSTKNRNDFLYYSCILFSYTYYLDESIDSLNNIPKSVCSNQIASFLLMRYTEWLLQRYDINALKSFYSYFDESSKYLIVEKKWEYPDDYYQEYGRIDKIILKAHLCLFPIELISRDYDEESAKKIQNLFTSYFSYLLLYDDIEDIEDDIQDQCLTYPIVMYYKKTGKLPTSKKAIIKQLPELLLELKMFVNNIKELKQQNGWVLYEINEEIKTFPSFI